MIRSKKNNRENAPKFLPPVRGELLFGENLARYAWFRVGGPAEVLFRPADTKDLQEFLQNIPAKLSITVIGVASNLLIRDGGVPGVVIQLRKPFNTISLAENTITAGAGALDISVARFALSNGFKNLEFLSGIPGTIGGALRMNAGAYGSEIKDILITAEAIDREGNIHTVSNDELRLTYCQCHAPKDWIFLKAQLAVIPGKKEKIAAKMVEIAEARAHSQPIKKRTGGSTFKNTLEKPAWQLIDEAGCRGLRVGEAQVSEHHCNFLINCGHAKAYDLEHLAMEVRRRVHENSGLLLEWELDRVGLEKEEADS